MSCPRQFSEVTKRYLCCFYEILDEMIDGMTKAELTDSISHNFIVQMIPHHEAAIEMSKNILQYTTFIPLQNIAQGIIEEQTQSIEDMKNVLSQCDMKTDSQCDLRLYQECVQQIMQAMFSRMRTAASTNQINANFMREMIPHHMGAVNMSENALRYSVCPELVPILKAIITSQERGIREMKRLLQCMSI